MHIFPEQIFSKRIILQEIMLVLLCASGIAGCVNAICGGSRSMATQLF